MTRQYVNYTYIIFLIRWVWFWFGLVWLVLRHSLVVLIQTGLKLVIINFPSDGIIGIHYHIRLENGFFYIKFVGLFGFASPAPLYTMAQAGLELKTVTQNRQRAFCINFPSVRITETNHHANYKKLLKGD